MLSITCFLLWRKFLNFSNLLTPAIVCIFSAQTNFSSFGSLSSISATLLLLTNQSCSPMAVRQARVSIIIVQNLLMNCFPSFLLSKDISSAMISLATTSLLPYFSSKYFHISSAELDMVEMLSRICFGNASQSIIC